MSPHVRNTIAAADDAEVAQPWLNPQIKRIALGAGAYIAFVAIAALWQGSINKLAVVLVAGQLILFATIVSWYEKHDEHRAETDETARKLGEITANLTDLDTIRSDLWAIKEDLTGNTASAGRHAPPQQRKPSPRPRSVA